MLVKIIGAVVLDLFFAFLSLLPGWFGYCYVAPLFKLPILTLWQFLVAGFTVRSLLGTGTVTTSKS